MKFLKSNILSITTMTFMFAMVMMGDASASVFGTAAQKLVDLFQNSKMVVFVIGGFGLIALAFQAIFGKIKWPWFAALMAASVPTTVVSCGRKAPATAAPATASMTVPSAYSICWASGTCWIASTKRRTNNFCHPQVAV